MPAAASAISVFYRPWQPVAAMIAVSTERRREIIGYRIGP